MKVTRMAALALVLFLLSACCANRVERISYTNGANTVFESFEKDPTQPGYVFWLNGGVRLARGSATSEDFTSSDLYNCSDEQHRCVYREHTVFAVPRAELSTQTTYVAGGAIHRVEKCLRGRDDKCERALISSECRFKLDLDRCIDASAGDSENAERGPTEYLVYDRVRGILSYGSSEGLVTGFDAQMAIAQKFRLRSAKGLLAPGALMPDIKSPKAPQMPKVGALFKIEDDPANLRFIVRMRWEGTGSYCLDDETWPTATGQIVNGNGWLLSSAGREMRPQEVNGGYCPNGCSSVLAPGDTREAFVNYSAFGDPLEIRSMPERSLKIAPEFFPCPNPVRP